MLSLYTLQPELMKLKSSRFSGDALKVRTLSLSKTLRMSLLVRSETKTGWSSILFDDMDSVMLVTGYQWGMRTGNPCQLLEMSISVSVSISVHRSQWAQWSPAPANQRPVSRSRDHSQPIRGLTRRQIKSSPAKGGGDTQGSAGLCSSDQGILITCSSNLLAHRL